MGYYDCRLAIADCQFSEEAGIVEFSIGNRQLPIDNYQWR
jgi:hypothetical protein